VGLALGAVAITASRTVTIVWTPVEIPVETLVLTKAAAAVTGATGVVRGQEERPRFEVVEMGQTETGQASRLSLDHRLQDFKVHSVTASRPG